MKSVSATEAKQRFDALIDAAQREPVVIRRQNRDVAVIVSVEDYERIRITGDEDLLAMNPWRGIPTVSPKDYLIVEV